jgi:hypothetical protein
MLLSGSRNTVTKDKLLAEGRGAFTYGLSFPPVTMSPSLRVVYIVNTGPV